MSAGPPTHFLCCLWVRGVSQVCPRWAPEATAEGETLTMEAGGRGTTAPAQVLCPLHFPKKEPAGKSILGVNHILPVSKNATQKRVQSGKPFGRSAQLMGKNGNTPSCLILVVSRNTLSSGAPGGSRDQPGALPRGEQAPCALSPVLPSHRLGPHPSCQPGPARPSPLVQEGQLRKALEI